MKITELVCVVHNLCTLLIVSCTQNEIFQTTLIASPSSFLPPSPPSLPHLPPSLPPSLPKHRGESQYLGHGDEDNMKIPKLVSALEAETIVQLAVGPHHTLALSESGNLYGWGKNSSGELDFFGEDMLVPKLLSDTSKQGIMYIFCGTGEVSIVGKGLLYPVKGRRIW